jgi:hypothetical protein
MRKPMCRFYSILSGVVVIATMSVTSVAWSQNLYYFYSARLRMPECRAFLTQGGDKSVFAQGQCAAVISELILTAKAICVPKDVPIGKAVRTVVQYIDARPARYDENFVQLAHEGLRKTWPCGPR